MWFSLKANLQDLELSRFLDGSCAVIHVKLSINGLDMEAHGVQRDNQL